MGWGQGGGVGLVRRLCTGDATPGPAQTRFTVRDRRGPRPAPNDSVRRQSCHSQRPPPPSPKRADNASGGNGRRVPPPPDAMYPPAPGCAGKPPVPQRWGATGGCRASAKQCTCSGRGGEGRHHVAYGPSCGPEARQGCPVKGLRYPQTSVERRPASDCCQSRARGRRLAVNCRSLSAKCRRLNNSCHPRGQGGWTRSPYDPSPQTICQQLGGGGGGAAKGRTQGLGLPPPPPGPATNNLRPPCMGRKNRERISHSVRTARRHIRTWRCGRNGQM